MIISTADYRRIGDEANGAKKRMTPAQLRGARAILGLTQDELAERSLVSRPSLSEIEAGNRMPQRSTMAAITRALVVAGIIFGADGSVRLDPRQ